MLVRQVTKDPEGVTDSGGHHLRYGYLPHTGTVADTRLWLAAFEFNQPLIATWKTNQMINVQLPFNEETNTKGSENVEANSPLLSTFSMLSIQNALIADLYPQGDQIEAVILNYDPTKGGTIYLCAQQNALPQSVF